MSIKLTGEQKRRSRIAATPARVRLTFVLEKIEKAANMAHALRLAEALQAEVVFVGSSPNEQAAELSTYFAPWRDVPRHFFPTFSEAMPYLEHQVEHVVAIEVSARSVPYVDIRYVEYSSLALVVGNESRGVEESTLRQIAEHVHIPMSGGRTCLNVGMALAIVASHIVFVDAARELEQQSRAA